MAFEIPIRVQEDHRLSRDGALFGSSPVRAMSPGQVDVGDNDSRQFGVFDHPSLRVVVLCRPRDDGEVLRLNLVGIQESTTAQLLDRVLIIAQGVEDPSLRVVVLLGPGHDGEVLLLNLVGVHKSAVALLLHGVRVVAPRYDDPALRVVVLCRPGNHAEVVPFDFMGIHESAIALLLDRVNRCIGRVCDAD